MFTVNSYLLAVIFCIVTMICWGSWGNTQKLVSKNWRYELFYWDYVIGMVLFTILLGFTMGSHGDTGRSFLEDLGQASGDSIGWVILGGVIFNASNILLSASISLAGMSVAFPLGVGLALGNRQLSGNSDWQSFAFIWRCSSHCYCYHLQWSGFRKNAKGRRKQEKQQKGNYHCINCRCTDVFVLQVRSERYGRRKLQFSCYRNDDSLFCHLCFFNRRITKQFCFQHISNEISFCRRKSQLLRIL